MVDFIIKVIEIGIEKLAFELAVKKTLKLCNQSYCPSKNNTD